MNKHVSMIMIDFIKKFIMFLVGFFVDYGVDYLFRNSNKKTKKK